MAQIIASANSVYDIPWPKVFSDFLDVMKLFMVDVITLTRAQCAAYMNYYTSLVVVLVLFKIVVFLVLLFAWAVPAARRYRRLRISKGAVPKAARSGSARVRVVSGRRRSVVMRLQQTDWVKVRECAAAAYSPSGCSACAVCRVPCACWDKRLLCHVLRTCQCLPCLATVGLRTGQSCCAVISGVSVYVHGIWLDYLVVMPWRT
jgi:hypothetical protein